MGNKRVTSHSKFLQWLDRVRGDLALRKEQRLLERNLREHRNKDHISSRKVIESFVAPPPFLLYLWAAFPLLLIATFEKNAIITGVVATLLNFFLIHLDTFQFVRFILASIVLAVVILLYSFGVI